MELAARVTQRLEREQTILTTFEESCARYPDRTALIFLGTGFSYRALRDLIRRFAAAFHDLGVKPGDRVLIYLPNSPQWLVAYLGLQKLGAVPVPVSPIYTPYELVYLINHSRSKLVLCADTNFGYVKEVLPKTRVEGVVVTRLADLRPLWKRAFGKIFDKLTEGSVSRDGRVYFFTELLRKSSPEPPAIGLDPASSLAHILYTGGTTGFPKGVPHTHLELLSGIAGIREVYRGFIGESRETLIMPLPLFHMFSQDMVFALGFHLGNTVVVNPKPNTDAVLGAIQRYGGTLLAGVPSLYRQILENDRLEFYHLRSLRCCWSAGDTLPVEVSARWKEKFGVPVYQVYGSTETVCISVTPPAQEPRPQGVGRLIPTRMARVVDPETLSPLPCGEEGELLVSSDYSYGAGGYLDNPAETKETYVRIEGRLWCRTGDYVKLSADGEVQFIDRRPDLIKHKGYRVSASRVESALQDHPAVVSACVVGAPDPASGERVKAFVILKQDVRGVTSYDLIRHCRARLLP
ncbi:MAG: acyl--CoA ligase, partial [Deltaproteobacteria bacterium]|nr:acyl--CoA ligase [Deltaproteobacteria bacterium]